MLKRLAAPLAAALALALPLVAFWPVDAARFEPVTNAQLAAGFSSCAGSGAVGTTFQVTGTNTFGCASASPGTGAVRYDAAQSLTAAQASQGRSNLLAAASGANSDLTSLSGLTTALSVAQGGTGGTSASTARTSLGAAASGANTDITSLASPALGAATATTAAAGDSSTKVATTGFVANATAALGAPKIGAFNNLRIAPGSTAASQVAVTADSLLLKGSSAGLAVQGVSATISTAAAGANGLDTGSLAPSTWYAIHGIAKADGTFAGLLSTSATAPTMPSGYAYAARIGWALTDASKNLVPIVQSGRVARYVLSSARTPPVVVNGAVGSVTTPTWVAVAISGFAPSTASAVTVKAGATSASNTRTMLAPNGNYGVIDTGPAAAPPNPPFANTAGNPGPMGTVYLESANVYAASESSGVIVCLGWEDNL